MTLNSSAWFGKDVSYCYLNLLLNAFLQHHLVKLFLVFSLILLVIHSKKQIQTFLNDSWKLFYLSYLQAFQISYFSVRQPCWISWQIRVNESVLSSSSQLFIWTGHTHNEKENENENPIFKNIEIWIKLYQKCNLVLFN